MSRAFFRFLRGELNGFYLTNIHQACNVLSEEYKTFLADFKAQQFETGKISDDTLYNLGKFAGIFLPRVSKEEGTTSIRLTESEYDESLDYEFSERGLFNPSDEEFTFEQKVIDDTGLPDINTLATSSKRSSLIAEGENPSGYIADDVTDVFDENGNVLPSAISSTPPENQAYSDFYSDKFIFLSDVVPSYENLSPDIFIELFKALQIVRYKGMNIKSIVDITDILCPEGLVTIGTVIANENYYTLTYHINMEVSVREQQDRLSMWQYIIKIKFPQVVLSEV